jgi:dTDP-glucose pyrophosphorylase
MSHNWKKILIKPEMEIKRAIKIIDDEGLRLALVVGANNNLLGTLSDGDIRRALINGISLDSEVKHIMNSSPKVAQKGTPLSSIRHQMQVNELLSIPIIDNNKLIGLETLIDNANNSLMDNPVFIMAGGFGKRLNHRTHNCPKPMLNVNGKPILESIIDNFISYGFHKFYISTHFLPEVITEYFGDGSKWGVTIDYVFEKNPLGTGGSLSLLPETINLPMIMMNGDVLTKIDFKKLMLHHISSKSIATMVVRDYQHQIPFGVVESKDLNVISMIEKPTFSHFVNAGIYVLNPEIRKEANQVEKIDMPDILQKQLNKKKKVGIYPLHEYWLDIGRPEDFNKAQMDGKNSLF